MGRDRHVAERFDPHCPFEVVSTASTTGFAIADYELWATLAQIILFMLPLMSGCAGATAGAMKAIRVQLFSKQASHGFSHTVQPCAVAPPRLGGKS